MQLIIVLVLIIIYASFLNRQPKITTRHYDADGKLTGSSESSDAPLLEGFWTMLGILFLIALALVCVLAVMTQFHLL